MRIKSFRLRNYKSFSDSGLHELAPHMNLVVGQNNAGKPTLLQALGHRMEARPHRDSGMQPDQADNPISRMTINFSASGQEMLNAALRGNWTLDIPVPKGWPDDSEVLMNDIFKMPEIVLIAEY